MAVRDAGISRGEDVRCNYPQLERLVRRQPVYDTECDANETLFDSRPSFANSQRLTLVIERNDCTVYSE